MMDPDIPEYDERDDLEFNEWWIPSMLLVDELSLEELGEQYNLPRAPLQGLANSGLPADSVRQAAITTREMDMAENVFAEIERYLDEAKNSYHKGDYAELLTLIIMAKAAAVNGRITAARRAA